MLSRGNKNFAYGAYIKKVHSTMWCIQLQLQKVQFKKTNSSTRHMLYAVHVHNNTLQTLYSVHIN